MDVLEEKVVRKNYVYQGKILSVRSDDALLPDGKPCKREIVEHSGGPFDINSSPLVTKYRFSPIKGTISEIVPTAT